MTQAVAYSNFRANLKTYMRRVNEDADTLLVTNADPEDNVVVMSADDYDSRRSGRARRWPRTLSKRARDAALLDR